MKDIDLAIEQGEELGVPMWVCHATRLLFKHAICADSENEDLTGTVRFVECNAGFEMPKTRWRHTRPGIRAPSGVAV